ncbi:MAG: class I SAM-dependent methyltransferase [Planctomycetota bacterium]
MLRISTEPEVATTAGHAASGSTTTPEVRSDSAHGMTPHVNPIAGKNHSAMLIPWITNELRFHSVIDLACGDGEAVRLLAEAGYESHGVDIDAPGTDPAITRADAFAVPQEAGYYDLVICANFAQELPDHRIPSLLHEINRLSNSYALISVPGVESTDETAGQIRGTAWWCQRLADFDWRIRLLREEPETGQIVMLIEKPDSLAAKILPLLDAETNSPSESTPTPAPAAVAPALDETAMAALKRSAELLRSALQNFAAGRADEGYLAISDMAHALAPVGGAIPGLFGVLGELVNAMETRDELRTIEVLGHEVLPRLQGALEN